jgi:hypothetical protein
MLLLGNFFYSHSTHTRVCVYVCISHMRTYLCACTHAQEYAHMHTRIQAAVVLLLHANVVLGDEATKVCLGWAAIVPWDAEATPQVGGANDGCLLVGEYQVVLMRYDAHLFVDWDMFVLNVAGPEYIDSLFRTYIFRCEYIDGQAHP